jgi:hypothetical protein
MSKPTITEEWSFDGSGKHPYVTRLYSDGSTSCNCPGWTRRVDGAGRRHCKHTTWVEMGVADRYAVSHVDWEATVRQTVAAPTPEVIEPMRPGKRRLNLTSV